MIVISTSCHISAHFNGKKLLALGQNWFLFFMFTISSPIPKFEFRCGFFDNAGDLNFSPKS